MMRRLFVIVAAIGVAAAVFAGGSAFADKLVPGGWLEPIQLPKPPPPPPVIHPADALPHRVEHRRERARARRPAPQIAPVTEGRVRF
jgi:hypothetical protein